ncbi:MAG TPA: hypothetical protein VL547_00030 [Dinghuibacter sp.]|uniref:hypothetical protein n=1 Tax=Dinghuibacter sp. TaxID=2024697 RepID=UPI002B70B125|nr:hypothetical protein [Dinghuibacter sp.]HTJ10373.1 hypothetical protein [Dinghuibacter sp.]
MLAKTYIAVAATACLGMGLTRVHPPADTAIRDAVGKSLPLLLKSEQVFIARSHDHCASCHQTSMTVMVEGLCGQKGVPVRDTFAAQRVALMENNLDAVGDLNHIKGFVEAKFINPYMMMSLYAAKTPADARTDKAVDYMIGQQDADGGFHSEHSRPPLEVGNAHLTALSVKAIQAYASPSKKALVQTVTGKARSWFSALQTDEQQELVFQLLGLYWTGGAKADLQRVAGRLLALQRADGGWAQLSTLASDAYATGQALYALAESGATRADDAAFQKGVRWLLADQDESGAWIVRTRTYPIQPFFNSDFPPYDENQYISATATNWAMMALLKALPDKGAVAGARGRDGGGAVAAR